MKWTLRRQMKSETPTNDNPLGRVMLVKEANKDADLETLELKLSERILKELPVLQSRLTLIKIIGETGTENTLEATV